VYGIVDDPQKFYFLVCAALIGVREIDFTRAAESRRSMSEKKTSALEKFIQSWVNDVKVVHQRFAGTR
jgi:hypothetical protein